MANLRFLQNVMHNGIIFKGAQPQKVDEAGMVTERAKPGMVIDLDLDSRGLNQPALGTGVKTVAEHLVDRGVAEFTTDEATHTSNLVNAAQEAVPRGVQGVAPQSDAVKAQQDAYRERMAANAPVTQAQLQQQPAAPEAPAKPAVPAQAPVDKNAQPSDEEVAATAAAAA